MIKWLIISVAAYFGVQLAHTAYVNFVPQSFDELRLGHVSYTFDEADIQVLSRQEYTYRAEGNPPENSYGYRFNTKEYGEVSLYIRERREHYEAHSCASEERIWPERIPPRTSYERFSLCFRDNAWAMQGVCFRNHAACRLFVANSLRPLHFAIHLDREVVDQWLALVVDFDGRIAALDTDH